LEIVISLAIVFVATSYFLCMHPDLMKEIFSFEKKPVEPVEPAPEPVEPVPGKAISRADSLAYEDMGHIHEPLQPPTPVSRHEIIKHDYYNSYGNERWPRWTCKCGDSGYAITTPYESLEATEREARRDGQDHVRKAIQIDERLKETDGKFAF
jgi:hypothetical protein